MLTNSPIVVISILGGVNNGVKLTDCIKKALFKGLLMAEKEYHKYQHLKWNWLRF